MLRPPSAVDSDDAAQEPETETAAAPGPGGAIPFQRAHVIDDMHVLSRADRAADAALVRGLAVDDQAVAAAFVRRFQGAVFGLAVAITRDSSMAEDVSQEVFVRA